MFSHVQMVFNSNKTFRFTLTNERMGEGTKTKGPARAISDLKSVEFYSPVYITELKIKTFLFVYTTEFWSSPHVH